jgi:hypothetical protein
MNTRLKILGTLLRKDLRLFWPLAVLTAALNAVDSLNAILPRDVLMQGLVVPATFLATSLFILLVFHEDSAVTGKHDWLTRPVPGMTMLAAKCILVAPVFLLPGLLVKILNGFHLGRPAEALVSGLADGLSGPAMLVFLCMTVFAALTSGIRQAVVAFLVFAVLLVVGIVYLSGGLLAYPPAYWFFDSVGTASGPDWMVKRTLQLLVAFTALVVLWILYGRHHGRRAALLVIGVAVLAGGAVLATISRAAMFSLQKRLSPDPAAASSVAVSLLPGCFPTRTLERPNEPARSSERIPSEVFSVGRRMREGTDSIAFAVRLIVDRIPEGAQLVVDRAQLTYSTPSGRTVSLGAGRAGAQSAQQWVKTESGQRAIDQYWLMSRKDYQRLSAAPGTTAHFDYSLSLLNPTATTVFAADGRRAFRSGVGYCSAALNPYLAGRVNVDCYRTGDQPALLAVRWDGQPDIEDRPSLSPNYTPAILDFWGGSRHRMVVAGAAASQVRVTAYEARAHFTRQFDVPGVLGAPVSSCPIP